MYTNSKVAKSIRLALAIAAATALSPVALAGDTDGMIVGKTVAATGSELAQVSITITNKDTGLTRTVTSDEDGNFRFPLLPIGQYKVTAEKNGYVQVVQETVNVGLSGRTNINIPMQVEGMERLEVRGSMVSMVDVSSSTAGIVVDDFLVSKVPVPRDVTGVALLAPGTTKGDSAFGNLPSIGGASVAENAFFVNGLNITDFRTGTESTEVPFEFYDTFEVKTGGYSAEFGRSTGGVINATTKSGSNEFHWGVNYYWEPESFREYKPDTIDPETGEVVLLNSQDSFEQQDLNIWASGAIIEDKLFFYAMFNPHQEEQIFSTTTLGTGPFTHYSDEIDDSFWGAKIDWYITEDHILEITGFSDARETVRFIGTYDNETGTATFGEEPEYRSRGGDNYIVKYTGVITDDFSLSAQYGVNKYDRTNYSVLDENPLIIDVRDGGNSNLGNWAASTPSAASDERKAYRVDADWYLGDHEIRFGIDHETMTASDVTRYSGGIYYRYVDRADSSTGDGVRVRHYNTGGEFETEASAFYIQDAWQITDSLVLNLGLRNDTFDNKNAAGETFVKMDNQWAPRLGAVWDVKGDGESKAWFSYGRYYLPVAANTNVRLSGAELFDEQYFELLGLNADDTPQIGDALTGLTVFGDGTVPDEREIVDQDLDAMYSDEYMLGYQFALSDMWSVGIQGTYRELSTTIEDVAIDAAVIAWAADNGYGDVSDIWGGFHSYVLTNPGTDMTIYTRDLPGTDGELTRMDLSAEDLGYPESVRKYSAIDLTVERAWDNQWFMKAAYTWSHSYGNNEGYVRSDNGQDDAGITTLFDQPGLLDGAYGNLPNDRRHALKVYGGYALTENLIVGANFSYQSGRPINAFGEHPTDAFAAAYGSESFYEQGVLVPRGSRGTTSSVTQLDLSLSYTTMLGDYELTFRGDVFNVLDSDTVTEVEEIADSESEYRDDGTPLPNRYYGLTENTQTPRYFRLSASLRY
ncbi:TonB-dependent receptor [Bowmanella dokdonensis]|uniref:TonB-dependent receptor n=1 Tax=Bowmanella dokdonensis TaxID=751969 RepID=A0A939DLM5_9ALTE|nr:TonB-dependent receptor [Bowmanella dokdonensis]MBN7824902.1 TonB-dependent receptor [Bowmanella dokdonensis]